MWHKSQSTIRPTELDDKSSALVVYVRKNIELVLQPKTDELEPDSYIYEYDEVIIPKDEWNDISQIVMSNDRVTDDHTEEISENSDGVFELAEMVSALEDRIAALEGSV